MWLAVSVFIAFPCLTNLLQGMILRLVARVWYIRSYIAFVLTLTLVAPPQKGLIFDVMHWYHLASGLWLVRYWYI